MHRRVRSGAHRGLRHRQSTPTPAASPRGPTWSAPIARPCLRHPIALWRHHRGQPQARCRYRAVITEILTEVIIAPDATDEAIAIIASVGTCACCWRATCRSARTGPDRQDGGGRTPGAEPRQRRGRRHRAQGRDQARAPTDAELNDLKFAFRVAKHVKSNTIIYAKDLATVGIGAGQMSRVDSARIAARKAQDAATEAKLAEPLTRGSVVASDAFFPFATACWPASRPAPPR